MSVIKYIAIATLLLGWTTVTPASMNRRTPLVEAVAKALPSVINIGTERIVKVIYRDPFFNWRSLAQGGLLPQDGVPPPMMREQLRHSLGSGVVVDENGYILTNYHVIEQASRIRVGLDNETTYDAVLLAGDLINDLALLKIETDKPLTAISFADDDDLLLGETVIALGNPFGFSQTVTAGVLSGINREARYRDRVLYRDILQTDAAVNYGSSGGPLVNLDGEMIGLNVQVLQDAQNIGFAVPIKRLRAQLNAWMSPRALRHGWLGFELSATDGALTITGVATNGALANTGIKSGDRILAVDGKSVSDVLSFNRALIRKGQGDTIRLRIANEDGERDVAIAFLALPVRSADQLARDMLGLVLTKNMPEQALRAGLQHGVGIAGVLADGPASATGMKPGLLLTRINDTEIRAEADVAAALQDARPGEFVKLRLVRMDEQPDFIVAEVTYWDVQAR